MPRGDFQHDSPALPGHGALATDGEQYRRLADILEGMGRVLVAYSGGVDSTFLMKVAHDVLGENLLGVLAVSESLDRNESTAAMAVAKLLGLPVRTIITREFESESYRRNDGSRCYHCKTELFSELQKIAVREGFPHVADGSNLDDKGDYRPGMRARAEHGVRSPLQEAGFSKAAIREYSRELGLSTWDKPAAPCLSSRIPYGSEVTREKLRQVEAAEAALRELGFAVVRVRHDGLTARIEVPPEGFVVLIRARVREAIVRRVKEAGFVHVVLDLQGFRSGALNEMLDPEHRFSV